LVEGEPKRELGFKGQKMIITPTFKNKYMKCHDKHQKKTNSLYLGASSHATVVASIKELEN